MRLFLLIIPILAHIDIVAASEQSASEDVGDGLVTVVHEEIAEHFMALGSDDVGDGKVTIVNEEIAHTTGSDVDAIDNDEITYRVKSPDGVGHVMLDDINLINAKKKEDEYTILSSTFTLGLNTTTSEMDSARQAMFVTSVVNFLEKIFESQDKYDVHVKSVTIVKQLMVKSGENTGVVSEEESNAGILELETVLVAEFKPVGDQALSNEDLKKIVLHVCERFEEHLVRRVKELDPFFAQIEHISAESHSYEVMESMVGDLDEETEETLYASNSANIVGITVGSVAFSFILAGSILYCRRNKRKKRELPTQKVSSNWSSTDSTSSGKGKEVDRPFTIEFNRHLPEPKGYPYGPKNNDPYGPRSYDPYQKRDLKQMLDKKKVRRGSNLELKREAQLRKERSANDSKTPPNTSFPGTEDLLPTIEEVHSKSMESYGSETIEFHKDQSRSFEECNHTRLSPGNSFSQTDIMKEALRKDCYAPPGKLGVAIDTINGQPVVHRIKPGSPLDGTLERFDRIVAIDDTDTSCMSAADVTQLMVKNMNKERKISYIRGGGF